MFDKVRDMYRLQKEAKRAKKTLKLIHVEAEARGVKVTVDGELRVVSITISSDVPRDQIAPLLVDALNRALGKAQIVAAEKMQGVMGELGIGG